MPDVRVSTTPKRPRGQTQRRVSHIEELLYLGLTAAGLHLGCVREHVYAPGRKFRADFAWPDHRLIVQVEGGTWSPKSGHSGGTGIAKDCARQNAATLAGWKVLRFPPSDVRSGEAVRVVQLALCGAVRPTDEA